MRTGYEIARVLKELTSENSNERTLRAMMVANSLAYFFPIDPSQTIETLIETHLGQARKVIGQVNESITLDSKLAQELFKQALRIRYELIHGAVDASIIMAAMQSTTAQTYQTLPQQLATTSLTSNLDFIKSQNSISAVLRQLESGAQ